MEDKLALPYVLKYPGVNSSAELVPSPRAYETNGTGINRLTVGWGINRLINIPHACNGEILILQIHDQRPRNLSISKVEGHWPKGALLYMTKIKRFYVAHKPNENF
jgi:hypothetical protein